MEKVVATPEEMEALGREFSRRLLPGNIVKLTGPLGAGKTTFVRGVVAGLGGDADSVHSPTFGLVHEYQATVNSIKHCDFYRLRDGSELEDFGGLEFFDSDSIFLVEWPEKIRLWKYVTSNRLLLVDLQHNAAGRSVSFSSNVGIVD